MSVNARKETARRGWIKMHSCLRLITFASEGMGGGGHIFIFVMWQCICFLLFYFYSILIYFDIFGLSVSVSV